MVDFEFVAKMLLDKAGVTPKQFEILRDLMSEYESPKEAFMNDKFINDVRLLIQGMEILDAKPDVPEDECKKEVFKF